MITPIPATDASLQPQAQQYNIGPSVQDLQTLGRGDIIDVVKQFLLRQVVKKEVQENERSKLLPM